MLSPINARKNPNPKCDFCNAKLTKERVLGTMPQFFTFASVLIRCKKCKKINRLVMPAFIVEKVIDMLQSDPEGEDVISILTPISDEEVQSFGDALRQNPFKLLAKLEQMTHLGDDFGLIDDMMDDENGDDEIDEEDEI